MQVSSARWSEFTGWLPSGRRDLVGPTPPEQRRANGVYVISREKYLGRPIYPSGEVCPFGRGLPDAVENLRQIHLVVSAGVSTSSAARDRRSSSARAGGRVSLLPRAAVIADFGDHNRLW